MGPSRGRLRASRVAHFESLQSRLLLAADPLGDVVLDYFVEDQLYDEVQTALSDAHALTGLDQVRQQYGLTGLGQTVAVIDTGIAYTHEALGGGLGSGYRVVGGFDFSEERDLDPYDDGPYGLHGTHVAGIIGSSDPAAPGVAPGTDLVALRVFNDEGESSFVWVEEALRWVHQHRHDFENPITTVNLSLGGRFNGDAPPSWAILEDELAALEADGIFIAVAAGNSFTTYDAPGLSYPAASGHVVPVASVDDDGGLSYFSQRSERVIAAPGRSVLSAVPDYAGDRNGIDDDFGRLSGTSMATPYVAGASVLLREAYQFAGSSNVDQSMIYQVMANTADPVYDAATGLTYNRLNLARAINAVMPADDFGSTLAAAHNLGTVADTLSIQGAIGRLGDADWFSFTAGATGSVTVAAEALGQLPGSSQVLLGEAGGAGRAAGGTSFDVVAGQTYAFHVSAADGLAHYGVDLQLEAAQTAVDWGTVLQARFDGYQIAAGGTQFTFTAARDGFLTAEAFFAHAGGDVDLQLYDAAHRLLATSTGSGDSERIDVTVAAGDRLYLEAYTHDASTNDQVDFRLTNLVSQVGSTVDVAGTAAGDTFAFQAGQTYYLSINGVDYQFDAGTVSTVRFEGGAGTDRVTLSGDRGDELVELRVGSATLSGGGYQVHATGVETVDARGGGGFDRAVLYDSAGDDTLIAAPGYARLSGPGFDHLATGFAQTETRATAGGLDVAKLYDSAGNDTLVAVPDYAVLFGDSFANHVQGFDQVHAYATAGGTDVAKLYDSAGDDVFYADPTHGALYNAGFYNRAKFFEQVHAYATAGGTDTAYLRDSAGDDVFYADAVQGALYGSGFFNRAKFFEAVHALGGSGGYDQARFDDSAADDQFRARDDWARLVDADSAAWVYGFASVQANSAHGGHDTAEIDAVDFLLRLDGDWS